MTNKKILVVLTNTKNYEGSKEKTGLWLAEATEFVNEVTKNGYSVEYVSPKGEEVPIDPRSMKKMFVTKTDLELFESEDFKTRAINNSLKPDDVNVNDYIAIYYTGGHGVIWDFLDNTKLQEISSNIYKNGGYVCSVCHGLVGLLNIKDENGDYLIKNKKITGFTNFEEVLSGKLLKVPFLTEKEARKRGAIFKQKLPFTEFGIVDKRVVTGQNPMSGKIVAKLLLDSIKKDKGNNN